MMAKVALLLCLLVAALRGYAYSSAVDGEAVFNEDEIEFLDADRAANREAMLNDRVVELEVAGRRAARQCHKACDKNGDRVEICNGKEVRTFGASTYCCRPDDWGKSNCFTFGGGETFKGICHYGATTRRFMRAREGECNKEGDRRAKDRCASKYDGKGKLWCCKYGSRDICCKAPSPNRPSQVGILCQIYKKGSLGRR